ncbi:MAG: MogA/MoaB family molybdenum cofactor biosynthesis protein [Nitrospinae bacterium]|nr:MogA/MoaB family molybdenum cofactor biosynthesis protein [Nitrospinota bacterium]
MTSVHEHRAQSPTSVSCAVITVSDTRTEATDTSGQLIRDGLEGAGHRVLSSCIVPDEPPAIRRAVEEAAATDGVKAILLTGGTGITPRDRTHEVVSEMLDKRMDGFGELFRVFSYEEIGAAAMLSRAVGGVAKGALVFAMPGSRAAVRLAMEKLILPELGHLVFEMEKRPDKKE